MSQTTGAGSGQEKTKGDVILPMHKGPTPPPVAAAQPVLFKIPKGEVWQAEAEATGMTVPCSYRVEIHRLGDPFSRPTNLVQGNLTLGDDRVFGKVLVTAPEPFFPAYREVQIRVYESLDGMNWMEITHQVRRATATRNTAVYEVGRVRITLRKLN